MTSVNFPLLKAIESMTIILINNCHADFILGNKKYICITICFVESASTQHYNDGDGENYVLNVWKNTRGIYGEYFINIIEYYIIILYQSHKSHNALNKYPKMHHF